VFWEFAHEDYLQQRFNGVAEAAIWTLILLGGLGAGFRNHLKRADEF
jgi:hypothetical protein